ncbi:MAG: hypothetical protein HUJ25_05970 [Crocinitomicaceae bacterium]|nr:hypothetical protein [Crocinitomicaceae bacterium]
MKLTHTRKLFGLVFLIGIFISCQKYDDGEVIKNTYTGGIFVNTVSEHPEGEFIGDFDTGEYIFAWDNKEKRAEAQLQLEDATSGSVQMIIRDKQNRVMLDETLLSTDGPSSFNLITGSGTPGVWEVSLVLISYSGEGSYAVEPED